MMMSRQLRLFSILFFTLIMLWSVTLAVLAFTRPVKRQGAGNTGIKLHSLFSEGAILQREKKIPVWGTARSGEPIIVEIAGQRVSTTAENDKFMVYLKPLKAGGPYTLKVQGDTTVEVKNLYAGEVFVCGGQSNMEWPLAAAENGTAAIADANDPDLHFYHVPKTMSFEPLKDVNAKWEVCTPANAGGHTAVGYFFAKLLRQKLKVPVGLIESNWGGTPAEAWTSREALRAKPSLDYMVKAQDDYRQRYPALKEAYDRDMQKYQKDLERSVAENTAAPKKPQEPGNPLNPWAPSTLYNGMIAPLLPYGIRGAIWYQGESNAGRAYQYGTLFPTMIQNWRDDWLQDEFPFYFVQLAPWEPAEPGTWPELRETQLKTLKMKNTGMAVITDVGDKTDIHPRKKQPVGERLALWALAKIYNLPVEYSGPQLESIEFKDGKAYLTFAHVAGGLSTSGDGTQGHGEPLTGFEVVGPEGNYSTAEARIEGNKVVVWSKDVTAPVAVRYGWKNYPVVNLFNRAGLPATPFRTDDFPYITKGR